MTNSTWQDYKRKKNFPKLEENLEADVVIIGGGLAGVLTSYLLGLERLSVVLLEKDQIGSFATPYTTAFITRDIDTDLTDIQDMFGKKSARLVWESGQYAVDLIEQIIKKEEIDCEFKRCSAYVYAIQEKEIEGMKQEALAANRLGFDDKFKNKGLDFPNHGFVEIRKQAKFHPLKFLYNLADQVQELGVRVFENSEVKSIKRGRKVAVYTADGKMVSAKNVVVTTYQPFNNPKQVFAKKGMYTSYVMEARVSKNLFKEGLYWDQNNPYLYFRIDSQTKYDRMILGGADHRQEIPMSEKKNFKDLETYLKNQLQVSKYKIVKKWSGLVLEPSDGLPLIGEYKPNHYVACGFSGNGMTYSAISAKIITDKIMGRKNAWVPVYTPNRPRIFSRYYKKGLKYLKEFFGGAVKNSIKYRK